MSLPGPDFRQEIYDNGIKQAARSGGGPEAVMEHELVKEQFDKILATLQNEEAERKATEESIAGLSTAQGGVSDAADELELLRKPPSQHSEGSEQYWKSVGNMTVRTYCTLQVEPKTLEGMISIVSQSPLREFQGEGGKSCVMTHLDCDALGESLGPGQRPLLWKKFVPESTLLKRLVQGSMIGRNGQRKGDECTCPAEGEMIFIHSGMDRSSKEAETLFRPGTARKDQAIDAEVKDVTLIFSDSSIRSRKQRNRGCYSSKSTASLFSAASLTTMVPEKAYPDLTGHNTGDVCAGIPALQPEDLWHLTRPHMSWL